mgnify:CR=1 FL=1
MPAAAPAFDAAEYARRLAATRAAMAARGLAALFLEDPSNMAWLTGYDGWSFYVHQGVVIPAAGDPVWWGRAQDAAGACLTVWMDDDRVRPYGEHYIQTDDRHPMQDLAGLLTDLGLAKARIGVELENYYYSAKAHITLTEALPSASLEDATALVNLARAVKSAPELALMRAAARITEAAMQTAVDGIAPGRPKNALVAEIFATQIRGTENQWGDYPAIVPLQPTRRDAGAPHLTWDGRPFRSGEATFFELSGCVRRYHAPFCRTVHLGPPPADMERAAEAVAEGIEDGLAAARPGAPAGDVARALRASLAKRGLERDARCGYPIGLSYPPDWGERTLSFRETEERVLEPGMTFHFMPGLWTPDWGLEITETILIREDGPAECLTTWDRSLIVK